VDIGFTISVLRARVLSDENHIYARNVANLAKLIRNENKGKAIFTV
jgi:hypothetical protein